MQNHQLLQSDENELMLSFLFLQLMVVLGQLNISHKILHGIDAKLPVLPRDEHVTAEYADIANCMSLSLAIANQH